MWEPIGGGSAYSFAVDGWKVFCFEPDSVNREKLSETFSGLDNVLVDSRAVGENVEKWKSFGTDRKKVRESVHWHPLPRVIRRQAKSM